MLLERTEVKGACRGEITIKNVQPAANVIYKIKTTAPNLFTVKPITGVIGVGQTDVARVQLLISGTSDEDAMKNKFLIQSAIT